MTYKLRTRKALAFIVVIVALACAAGFTRPKPFPNAALGADWQCSKTLIMTSCTKVVRVSPVLDHHDDARDMRAAGLIQRGPTAFGTNAP
jgi:hypothetical protein